MLDCWCGPPCCSISSALRGAVCDISDRNRGSNELRRSDHARDATGAPGNVRTPGDRLIPGAQRAAPRDADGRREHRITTQAIIARVSYLGAMLMDS